MNSELLAKQIETYSNAIVAFFVLQGVTFLFYFGTNKFFNCLLKTSGFLAVRNSNSPFCSHVFVHIRDLVSRQKFRKYVRGIQSQSHRA
jgi:hypothetical protein